VFITVSYFHHDDEDINIASTSIIIIVIPAVTLMRLLPDWRQQKTAGFGPFPGPPAVIWLV